MVPASGDTQRSLKKLVSSPAVVAPSVVRPSRMVLFWLEDAGVERRGHVRAAGVVLGASEVPASCPTTRYGPARRPPTARRGPGLPARTGRSQRRDGGDQASVEAAIWPGALPLQSSMAPMSGSGPAVTLHASPCPKPGSCCQAPAFLTATRTW